jgi:sec-independent protein translocase protein TatB
MLFDLSWSEILLIGTVALVFIGPKDLPKAMRVAGFWMRKARTLSREFQSSIDQMIREAELDEMRQELKKAAEFDLNKEFHNTIDPEGHLAESLKPPELPDFSATRPAPAAAVPAETPEAPMAAAVAAAEAAELHPLGSSEPVPFVPPPESEPDAPASSGADAIAATTAETGAGSFVPPKP